MENIKDDYLKHYIKLYRESINVQDERIRGKLASILDKAVDISDDREEFFELLSYGNFKLTQSKGTVDIESILEDMELEKYWLGADRLSDMAFPFKEEVPVDPFKVCEEKETSARLRAEVEKLPEEERKVITSLYYNDGYVTSLVSEMQRSQDYILTLQKSALRHIALGLSLVTEETEKTNTK